VPTIPCDKGSGGITSASDSGTLTVEEDRGLKLDVWVSFHYGGFLPFYFLCNYWFL